MLKTTFLLCLAVSSFNTQNAGAADYDGARYPYTWSESRYGGPGSWSAARYGGAGSWNASRYGGPGSWNASRYGGPGSWSASRYGGTANTSSSSGAGFGNLGNNQSTGWSSESARYRTQSEVLRTALSHHEFAQAHGAAMAAAVPNGRMTSSQYAAYQLGNQTRNTFMGILQHEFGSPGNPFAHFLGGGNNNATPVAGQMAH